MKVSTGRLDGPYRMLVTGTEGIGKTGFAAQAEGVIFFDVEQGTNHLDTQRALTDDGRPLNGYADVLGALAWLTQNEHPFRVLAIDTLDALNGWIEQYVCEKNKWESIETPGYGKGFTAAIEEWRRFFAALERLQRAKRMSVLSVAHALARKVNLPDQEPYDVYDLKLPEKPAALAREWHDAHLFARHVVATAKREGAGKMERAKALDTGEREVITRERAFAKAKNRWCLPAVMRWDPMTTFAEIERLRRRDPAKLLDAFFEKAPEVVKAKADQIRERFAAQPDKLFAVQRLCETYNVEV